MERSFVDKFYLRCFVNSIVYLVINKSEIIATDQLYRAKGRHQNFHWDSGGDSSSILSVWTLHEFRLSDKYSS